MWLQPCFYVLWRYGVTERMSRFAVEDVYACDAAGIVLWIGAITVCLSFRPDMSNPAPSAAYLPYGPEGAILYAALVALNFATWKFLPRSSILVTSTVVNLRFPTCAPLPFTQEFWVQVADLPPLRS